MTTSQRELLLLLANLFAANVAMSGSPAQKKISELVAEINAGSQELR